MNPVLDTVRAILSRSPTLLQGMAVSDGVQMPSPEKQNHLMEMLNIHFHSLMLALSPGVARYPSKHCSVLVKVCDNDKKSLKNVVTQRDPETKKPVKWLSFGDCALCFARAQRDGKTEWKSGKLRRVSGSGGSGDRISQSSWGCMGCKVNLCKSCFADKGDDGWCHRRHNVWMVRSHAPFRHSLTVPSFAPVTTQPSCATTTADTTSVCPARTSTAPMGARWIAAALIGGALTGRALTGGALTGGAWIGGAWIGGTPHLSIMRDCAFACATSVIPSCDAPNGARPDLVRRCAIGSSI